jgi:hypothetical protein
VRRLLEEDRAPGAARDRVMRVHDADGRCPRSGTFRSEVSDVTAAVPSVASTRTRCV